MATAEKSSPKAAGESAHGWRIRVKAWVEEAYTRPGSRSFRLVLDLTVFLVLVSLLTMVLESVPELEDQYRNLFFAVECVVVVLFAADYVLNVLTAPSKRGYVLGIWGLIDLLAILPFFLTLTNLTGLRAGRTMRTLRALRALRVLKLARLASASDAAVEEARSSFWRDLQFGLIGACSLVVLAHVLLSWETEQLFWLVFGGGAAANLALRRWLLQRERRALATLLVFAGLAAGVAASMAADAGGDQWKAGAIAIVTVLFIVGSVSALEGPAGAL